MPGHLACRASEPCPHVFLSTVARRTRRLRFGSLICALSMHHQLRVSEEVCMLDRCARRAAAIRCVFHREVMPTPVIERWQSV